jgi:hypothetical protein
MSFLRLKELIAACALLGAWGWTAWSVMLLIGWLWAVPAGWQTRDWPPVPGQVQTAYTSGCGGRAPTFDLSYTYEVAGRRYTGTELGGSQRSEFWWLDCGKALTLQLNPPPFGMSKRAVQVYVNPQDVRQAVLIRGAPPSVRPARVVLWALCFWTLTHVMFWWLRPPQNAGSPEGGEGISKKS